jgi:hypothetical protein
VVVRAQGGNNAGHTVISNGVKYMLHLMPSGILWGDKVCVIGNGVVMDPIGLAGRMAKLRGQGVAITPDNLLISDCAHLAMPYHKGLDKAREAASVATRKSAPPGAASARRMQTRWSAWACAAPPCATRMRFARKNSPNASPCTMSSSPASRIEAVNADEVLPKLREASRSCWPRT